VPINTVCVMGLGYIGLPTAAMLASQDVKVVGVDVDPGVVDAVNRGVVPFVEPGLATYVAGAVRHGTLRAAQEPEPADAYVIAVPTPLVGQRKPDLSAVEAAVRSLAPVLRGGELVVLESTAPPGTTERVAGWIDDERPDLSTSAGDRPRVHVAHCPERVLPGRVMIELVTNDRVIGGLTPEAAQKAKELYGLFCQGEILLTDTRTAELTKLVENAYRDVNLAFANELSLVADRVGVDVWELIRLANHHPRVDILRPGPGVGGHCVAVDPWFLVDAAPDETRLVRAAREVNDAKPPYVVWQVLQAVEGVERPRIAILGLTFKANVDDLRESPAVQVVAGLATNRPEAEILVVDPHVERLPDELGVHANVELCDLGTAVRRSDLRVLLVDHVETVAALRQGRIPPENLVDTRGVVQRGGA
jgi:UDP-N-acetyl-D-mannosaminuronic acid dehydrogenase